MIEPTTIGPSLIVAFVKSGFAFRAWSGNNLSLPLQISRAEGVNPTLLANVNAHDADATLFLQFFELLPTAFKTAAEEGSGADCGTRFRVEFNCLPEDVRVFVTTRDMPVSGGNAARAVLVSSEYDRVSPTMSSAATSATNVGGVPAVEVPLQNGRGTAIWEWISTDVASLRGLEELVFGIAVSALAGGWIVGSALIGGTLAPTINYPITVRDFRASTDAPVPRFVNVSQSIHAISFVP